MTTMPATIPERIPMPLDMAARPTAAASGITVGDVIGILKRRIFLILFIWFFIIGAAGALTYYWRQNWPSYRASALVFVESPFPKTPLQIGENIVQAEIMDRFVQEQAVQLTNDEVLRKAVEDASLRDTAWFGQFPTKEDAVAELKDNLSVKQVPRTSYLAVSFDTRTPADAPVIVNTVVEKYIAHVETTSRQSYGAELEDYQNTLDNIDASLKRIRAEKERFITENLGVAGVTEGLNIVGETYSALAAEVTRLEAEKLQYKAAYENLISMDPAEIAISPEMQFMIEQDPEVMGPRQQLNQLEQARLVLESQGLGEDHRQIRNLVSQIEVIEQQLLAVRAEKERKVREYRIDSAQTLYLNATQAELQLRERMLEAEARQRDLDRGLARFHTLEDEQYMLEEQYNRVSNYMDSLRMVVNQRGMVRVRRAGQAQPPREMHQPKWQYNMPAGAFLGLLLGVGLAVLLELVDTSVKTSRDVVRHVHVPILGTIPDVDDEEVDIDSVELACKLAPRSMVAEAFRSVRTNLLLSAPAERERSVVITSSRPEEGKTAVATNLAISLAQSGRKVLLVDANFHRPQLHQLFPDARREGLSNVLVGQAKVLDVASRTDLPNLDVLTSGPTPPNPTELLAGSYLRQMIAEATERYDQIIFDAPPVLLVSDVLAMMGSVDGCILVCRAKGTSRGTVLRAREQIERVDGHIFGAVLNAAQVRRGGYFREQIRTYYDYQSEEALTSVSTHALPSQEDGPGPNPDDQTDKS